LRVRWRHSESPFLWPGIISRFDCRLRRKTPAQHECLLWPKKNAGEIGHPRLCSGERCGLTAEESAFYGNRHTRRDKDWLVGDSLPGLLPAEGKDSGGSVAIFEFDVPAGAKVPIAHCHDACEETLYGIDGVLTFTLEGRKIEVGPGDALCIPRGAVHRFDNLHSANSRTLAIVILGPDYFREIAAVAKVAAASIPPALPDPAALAEVMRRHGLTPASKESTRPNPQAGRASPTDSAM
jgi:quercetin dioxygenase-like cupin family protein